jgi:hypothetical protein
MNIQERDKKAYQLARQFLLKLHRQFLTTAMFEEYLNPKPEPRTVYWQMLESARNADRKSGVIPSPIVYLKDDLCQFNPKAVIQKYGCSDRGKAQKRVLRDLVKHRELKGRPRGRTSILALYARTIVDAARFLARFKTDKDFDDWVEFFNKDERARLALPLLIHEEIKGLGFALASDFLKERGYTGFPKPDRHIHKIFTELNLCAREANNFEVARAVVRLAENAGVTAYNADKVFWLIGSGNFYKHKDVGHNGRVRSIRREFIAHAKRELA